MSKGAESVGGHVKLSIQCSKHRLSPHCPPKITTTKVRSLLMPRVVEHTRRLLRGRGDAGSSRCRAPHRRNRNAEEFFGRLWCFETQGLVCGHQGGLCYLDVARHATQISLWDRQSLWVNRAQGYTTRPPFLQADTVAAQLLQGTRLRRRRPGAPSRRGGGRTICRAGA